MTTTPTRWPAAAAAVALLVLLGCSASQVAPAGPSSERLTLRPAGSADGAELGYAEYLPPGYGDATPRPLLVFLHGSDESGDGSESALDRLFVHSIPRLIQGDAWPEGRAFVVLMPQYRPAATRDCRLADRIEEFLAFATEHYDIDENRVYLTGLSCGATGTWDYLAAHGGEVVAGAVPIAGRATAAVDDAGCALGQVPIWAFHGEVDDIVPTADVEPAVTTLEACTDPPPVDLRLTIYPGVSHESWDQTYDLTAGHDIYDWLLEHEQP